MLDNYGVGNPIGGTVTTSQADENILSVEKYGCRKDEKCIQVYHLYIENVGDSVLTFKANKGCEMPLAVGEGFYFGAYEVRHLIVKEVGSKIKFSAFTEINQK